MMPIDIYPTYTSEAHETKILHPSAYVSEYTGVLACQKLTWQTAQWWGLDPDLVCSVINGESDFIYTALNAESGCMGLGQINPDAWLKDKGLNPFLLYNPLFNLKWTCHILNWLTNREEYAGDEKKIIAAYTLGHGAVDRLVKEHGDKWFGMVPYNRARYIEQVIERNWDKAKGFEEWRLSTRIPR